MKEVIEFKKSVIFKTSISEITDIDLSHSYKVEGDSVEGNFDVSGLYKMTQASVKEEEFFYRIPFAIAISDRIKKETISLTIADFNYEIQRDTLLLKMSLNMEFLEHDTVEIESAVDELLKENLQEEETIENVEEEINLPEELVEEEIKPDINTEEITTLTNSMNLSEGYVPYKIHITRAEETIDTIASKYKVSLDDIKEYNEVENISIGDKIIIPYIKNE